MQEGCARRFCELQRMFRAADIDALQFFLWRIEVQRRGAMDHKVEIGRQMFGWQPQTSLGHIAVQDPCDRDCLAVIRPDLWIAMHQRRDLMIIRSQTGAKLSPDQSGSAGYKNLQQICAPLDV